VGCSETTKPQSDPYPAAASPEELVQQLATAYRNRDLERLRTILADDVDLPQYLFMTAPGWGIGNESWGLEEELRLHQRMFEPDNPPDGQTPLPGELWLLSATITLTQETAFEERQDLYVSTQNPDGLAPDRWKVMDAIYGTNVLFDLQGEIDYQINGRAFFIVVEDLQKAVGTAGRFRILQWNDLGSSRKAMDDDTTWSAVKGLYR
jgi:hypothetical protein